MNTSHLRYCIFGLISLLAVFPRGVSAHVKWVAPFDVAGAPRPIGEVLNGSFITLFLISVVAVYLFFLADRFAYRTGVLKGFDESLKRLDESSILIMRVTAGIFLISVWGWYMVYGQSFYVTPELKTVDSWVPWVQLALGVCALYRPLLPIVGAGVLALYVLALRDYGIFHLLDYLIFLGVGYFFLAANVERGRWRQSGFVVLFASTGITLGWAAMEKFAYPHWTYDTLNANPDMLMGMTPTYYMILAGFVEFNLAFILLGAASIVGRLVAIGFQSIFILAIWKFGMIDAIGHLMIIAILFVLFMRGPTKAREMLVLREKAVWTEAYFMTGLYFLAFVLIFIGYYTLHYAFFGV